MSKYFTDFTEVGTNADRVKSTDYVVGYRSTGTPEEIKISSANLINNFATLLSPGAIETNKLTFTPIGPNVKNIKQRNLDVKVSEFFTITDFSSPQAAALACRGKRLFVSEASLILKIDPVTGDFFDIKEALDGIAGWHIEKGSTVTLQLNAGTHIVSEGLSLNHPFGENIYLVGDPLSLKSQVIIQINDAITFNNLNFNLFNCNKGNRWGLIDNLTINGKGLANGIWYGNQYAAIYVSQNASVVLGPNVDIKNWYYGLKATQGASIYCQSVTVADCGIGIMADSGSQIWAQSTTCTNNKILDETDNGFGIYATAGSQINCNQALCTGNYKAGIHSSAGAQIQALGSKANSNTYAGFLASFNGSILAEDLKDSSGNVVSYTQSKNNGTFAFHLLSEGKIHYGTLAGDNPISGNTEINKLIFTETGSTYAKLFSNYGSLTFNTQDTNSLLFFTNNNRKQIEIKDPGFSTTNWLNLYGGNSTYNPTISADGSSANIGLTLKTKGTGTIALDTLKQPINIKGVFKAGGPGVASYINAVSDDDQETVNIFLNPQNQELGGYVSLGSNVRFGSKTSITPVTVDDVTINGYITIIDVNGNEVKLFCGDIA